MTVNLNDAVNARLVPIGVKPRNIHDLQRAEELKGAIDRYTNANLPVLEEWVEEYMDIFIRYGNLLEDIS